MISSPWFSPIRFAVETISRKGNESKGLDTFQMCLNTEEEVVVK